MRFFSPVSLWFNHLQSREQWMLLLGGLSLLLIFIYFFLWEPFAQHRQQLIQHIHAQEQDLQWMRQAALQIQQLRVQQIPHSPTIGTHLLTTIENSIRTGDLAQINKRIEPQNEQTVRISFEQVEFTRLMQWLAVLHIQHHIQAQSITLERENQANQVRARLTLTPLSAVQP
ncbi:type II secretion system protein GspM [Thioflexithrix psekupsensis]|uniref:Type II secretion system protein M n=1 Tax=Thioflexithrix psekupsensis TaxID=1570016 RepID=A0A251XBX6_9GAMM|nr:type II secretion system protein GspM [Thioflexithrix psekupsensis]OUD16164.1 hypothetical protein TPSD3_00095 [Thioflexithrix psekupsensis]